MLRLLNIEAHGIVQSTLKPIPCQPGDYKWLAFHCQSYLVHLIPEIIVYGIIYLGGVMFGIAILTVSTSGYQGQREDTSGKAIQKILSEPEYQTIHYLIVPDIQDTIAKQMIDWSADPTVDLIVSTGGTGLGQQDVTPEACLSVIDKEVPGLAEAMRAKSLEITPMAMLSRSVCGVRDNTLIITLPGSPKGVSETLAVVQPVLPHALELLKQASVNEHPV